MRLPLGTQFTQIRFRSSSLSALKSHVDYLNYCQARGIDVRTSYSMGTMYELSTRRFLEDHFHCRNLRHNGGSFDNGVDLFGTWDLSHHYKSLDLTKTKLPASCLISKSIQYNKCSAGSDQKAINLEDQILVLVQCKNYGSRIPASIIRELAGIYEFHVKSVHDRMKLFVLLVSPFVLTAQAQTQIDLSRVPMIHIKLQPNKLLTSGDPRGMFEPYNWSETQPGNIYMNPSACKLLHGLKEAILNN